MAKEGPSNETPNKIIFLVISGDLMKHTGPTSTPFASLTIEIIHRILNWLPDKGQSVKRVSLLWRFLSSSLLGNIAEFVNKEYPFLVEGKVLSDAKYVEIFERQDAIYTQIANRCGRGQNGDRLSREALLRKELKEFFTFPYNPYPVQTQRRRHLAVASGVIGALNEETRLDCSLIFVNMAEIGNLKALKKWNEDPKGNEVIQSSRVWALHDAVSASQLECVKYLVGYMRKNKQSIDADPLLLIAVGKDAYGDWRTVAYLIEKFKDISSKAKGDAITAAGENKHLQCMWYLIKNCEDIPARAKKNTLKELAEKGDLASVRHFIQECKDLSVEDKEEALQAAAGEGQLACIKYFIEECGNLSAGGKGQALLCAAIGQEGEEERLKCVEYLIEKCKDISEKDKKIALQSATVPEYGHNEKIAQYLQMTLNNKVNPPVTFMHSSGNNAKHQSDDEGKNENKTGCHCSSTS